MKALAFVLAGLVMGGVAEAQVRLRSKTFTPVITASAYAQGDTMGVLQKVTGLLGGGYGVGELGQLTVIDKAAVSHDVGVMFFKKEVTVSADNAALAVADAIMVESYLGRVSVAAGDYAALAGSSEAVKLESLLLAPGSGGSSDVWILLVCEDAGGCDYAATDDLTLKFVMRE